MAIDLVHALHDAGARVMVVTTQPSENQRASGLPAGVLVENLPDLLPDGAAIGEVVDRADDLSGGVVHILNSRMGLDAIPAIRDLAHSPAIVCHLVGEEGTGGGYPPYASRLYGRDIDAFVVVSGDLSRAIAEYGAPPDRVHVVPPRVDLAAFNPARRRENRANGLRILMPARLAEEKQPLLAIAAISELRRRGIPAELCLTGDGPMRTAVDQAIASEHDPGAFRAPGIVDDMAREYADHDVVLLTSKFEATPVALCEAMAMGMPVVAPSVGGIPDLVGDAGVLVQTPSALAYADALEPLVSPDARRQMGMVGRARAEELLGPRETTERLIEIHRSAVPERAA